MKSFSLQHLNLLFLLITLSCRTFSFNDASTVRQKDPSVVFPEPAFPELGRPMTLSESTERLPSERESMHKLSKARVAIADYDLIRADFGISADVSDAQIDSLLVDNFALMSVYQFTNEPGLSDQMPVKNEKVIGYRPENYGRAHWIPFDRETLRSGEKSATNQQRDHETTVTLELKGSGARIPVPASENSHGNGLMFLAEAMREYSFSKISEILKKEKPFGYRGIVPSYAVLDLGFSGYYQLNLHMPAALLLRRSHVRQGLFSDAKGQSIVKSSTADLQHRFYWEHEAALRKYGMTSVIDNRKYKVAIMNMQVNRNMELVDFGAYSVRERFDFDLLTHLEDFLDTRHGENSPRFYIKKNSAAFVQPDPALRLNMKRWGRSPLIPIKNNFLDNVTLAYAAAGDLFKLRAIDKGKLFAIHCWLMSDSLMRIGVDPRRHTSTRSCENGPTLQDEEVIHDLESNETVRKLENSEDFTQP